MDCRAASGQDSRGKCAGRRLDFPGRVPLATANVPRELMGSQYPDARVWASRVPNLRFSVSGSGATTFYQLKMGRDKRPSLRHEQALRKRPLPVDPLGFAGEAGVARHLEDFIPRVLVAALGPDGLARGEPHGKTRCANVTVCARFERKCISTLRACELKWARARMFSTKSASSSRLIRASRFRLNAAVTPSESA